jgi:hypothetical protein
MSVTRVSTRSVILMLAVAMLVVGVAAAARGAATEPERTEADFAPDAVHHDAVGDVVGAVRRTTGEDITSVAVGSDASTVSFRVSFLGVPLRSDDDGFSHGVSVAIDVGSPGPWGAPYGAWVDYDVGIRGGQTTAELTQGPALLERGVEPWPAPRTVRVAAAGRTVTLTVDRDDLGLHGWSRCFFFVVASDRIHESPWPDGGVLVQGGVDTAPHTELHVPSRPFFHCVLPDHPADL